jgi:hypothetical protein
MKGMPAQEGRLQFKDEEGFDLMVALSDCLRRSMQPLSVSKRPKLTGRLVQTDHWSRYLDQSATGQRQAVDTEASDAPTRQRGRMDDGVARLAHA